MTLAGSNLDTRAASLAVCCLACFAPAGASAQDLANFEIYQTGFPGAVYMDSPPGEPERIIIAQLNGTMSVIENGVLLPTPFLDIGDRLKLSHGLIGVAFPPDYATSRRFYVNYTDAEGGGPRVCRYTTSDNPNVANPDEEVVLETGLGRGDHNGGWMDFGPDGYLYIGRGDSDGTLGGFPESAQDIEVLRGKMLRIDVSTDTGYAIPPDNPFVGVPGRDEIIAIGLRNPWRSGFDSLTGDLYIADVGNVTQEEVTYLPYGSAVLGLNLGWPCLEGTFCRISEPPCSCSTPPMTAPIHSYPRSDGQSVIGGFVYRGDTIPRWRGRYFFLDYIRNRIWSFRAVNGVRTDLQQHTADLNEALAPSPGLTGGFSFGSDADGEIYVLEGGGRILKIMPEFDPADWNLDAGVNSSDFFDFLVDFFEGNADLTGDHQTTSADFFEYLLYFFDA